MFNIVPLDRTRTARIQKKIDQKTKPIGALGELESLALKLALILDEHDSNEVEGKLTIADPLQIERPAMLIFAGDHGIAKHGVSIAPPEVTQQMVNNFLDGGAAINCFCRTNEIELEIIDAGILVPIDRDNLTQQSLGCGTENMVEQAAMSELQVERGLKYGRTVVERHIAKGSNILAFGEMGIGNTSASTAIQAAIMNLPVEECVGRGTGITEEQLKTKIRLISTAVEYHRKRLGEKFNDPIQVMASFGGFEIVQIVGAMLTAAEHKKVILVDGYIASAAALLAFKYNKSCFDYMVFCHQSEEQGHRMMLQSLGVKPLLDLGLRLGEGTGAALALPLIRAAASFYNDMASFDSAGIEQV
ncbi:MAG: nicotinate-nucleotide--dimethylbenzimidazole phosphoribosyltransferase [Kangiellaceae bacterium]|nr:nicotinate-nucleotide--dimethylbenzimidazole phosphoribosyltransferase [Kangiellaceae bacterium]